MVVALYITFGYILQSVRYITWYYGLVLFITFGYVVLKTIWYCFDVVLCDFSAMIYGI